jgi:hypothetical protein
MRFLICLHDRVWVWKEAYAKDMVKDGGGSCWAVLFAMENCAMGVGSLEGEQRPD